MHIVCVCVCVFERERGSHHSTSAILYTACVCVCVCVCVCEKVRERQGHISQQSLQRIRNRLNHSFFHTSIITVCHATLFPSRAGTDGKTKDIINCLYLHWKLKLAIMERGVALPTQLVVFGQSQCTVPVGQSEGLCRKWSIWERRGIKDLQCTVFEK